MPRPRPPKEQALEHPIRRRILGHLEAGGGTIADLDAALPRARSTLRHHVRKLERCDLVRDLPVGRERLLYLPGDEQRALRQHLLRHPLREELLERLEEGPARLLTLAEVVDTSPSNATHHLRRLEEAGLVEQDEGRRWHPTATPDRGEPVDAEDGSSLAASEGG